ncbi:MAG TPA: beta-galactosidase [Edaphobacter sp.]|uniref:beta-galactosidase n=1 Tax=Edaphobacter sp. TaxID=1934404 RepID=UPI002CA9C2EC|nr:beta-galactosidase [Edaphobacter sp.]HUZ94834.1 beta-galactosidase [Edaphobacter sp.]
MNRRNFITTAGAAIASLTLAQRSPALSRASLENVSSELLLFGTDYYPDQTPESLWEQDAAAMAATGITNVRIAEFAWALMEPSEGSFDFSWLERAVKILNAHGIAIILGTPSAAPPNWLSQKYPEVLEVNDHGVTLNTGARRFTCPSNKTYRRLSLAIATHMANTFASTPGIVGWQIDNELTLGESARCYCRSCREGFQQWLRDRYHSLDAINQAWGTAFWSNIYTDFTQIPVPLSSGAPPNPGLVLDYDRYQSAANVSFQQEQLTMLRSVCPRHFITTNNVAGLADTINARDLYRNLDFVASDNYPGFFAVMMDNSGTSASPEAVTSIAAFGHDFSRCAKNGKPFLIMEEQTGKSGQPTFCPQPEPGQVRLWSYQAVAHGAMGINYFRWDTATAGAEEYWHGMLRHDRSHSPAFDEIQQTLKELKSLGREHLNASYVADLALCFDYNSDWALAIQPGQPKLKYSAEALAWYGCISASHAGIDIVDATGDLSAYKVLFAPAMYIVTAEQADRIRAFVQAGGTFVSGFRLGVKDQHSRIVETPLPGLLRDVMGVELIDYQPIYSEKQGVAFTGSLAGPDADCHIWADILDPKKAEVLATYTGHHYNGKAAITSNTFGKGKAIYVGAHLDPADLARVLLTLIAASGVKSPIQAPRGVEVTSRRSARGTLTYLLNHTSTPQSVPISGQFKDIVTGTAYSGTVSLTPYGVRVLQSA